jgi:hypothetical protein
MSDSVKKYYELLEEGRITSISNGTGFTFIYESPDGGKTVTERPFGGDISDRVVISKPILSEGDKRDAYTILSVYSEESILEAARILGSR